MTKIGDMKVGILVGRFQPLHKGHVEAIEFAKNNSDKLYIIIGSAEKSNQKRNPFSFEERKRMIELAINEKELQDNISIVPINDANNHMEWIASIKNTIGEYNLIFTNDELTERFDRIMVHPDDGHDQKLLKQIEELEQDKKNLYKVVG